VLDERTAVVHLTIKNVALGVAVKHVCSTFSYSVKGCGRVRGA
jgi:hypothetical protein